METAKKDIIWTNDIDIDEWRDDIKEWYGDDELTDEEIYEYASRENDENFEAEREILNVELGKTIVMIARLGLWFGNRDGYKFVKGSNLNDIFSGTCGDYVTWYIEDGDVKCDDIHHDGTNHYTYRTLKDGISEFEFEELIAEGKSVDELTDKMGSLVFKAYGRE